MDFENAYCREYFYLLKRVNFIHHITWGKEDKVAQELRRKIENLRPRLTPEQIQKVEAKIEKRNQVKIAV